VTVEFSSFILVATYVPNSGVMDLARLPYRTKEWDVDFFAFCKGLETKHGKPVIICGDLNVAHQEIDVYGAKTKTRNAGYTIEERTSFG
jgi:exonuclease III